jgi:hypothetical protein
MDDEDQIRLTLALHAQRLDEGDADGYTALYNEDGQFTSVAGTQAEKRSASSSATCSPLGARGGAANICSVIAPCCRADSAAAKAAVPASTTTTSATSGWKSANNSRGKPGSGPCPSPTQRAQLILAVSVRKRSDGVQLSLYGGILVGNCPHSENDDQDTSEPTDVTQTTTATQGGSHFAKRRATAGESRKPGAEHVIRPGPARAHRLDCRAAAAHSARPRRC